MYSTLRLEIKRVIRQLHGNILTQVNGWFLFSEQRVAPVFSRIYQGNFGLIGFDLCKLFLDLVDGKILRLFLLFGYSLSPNGLFIS